jgi:hypothetical protein
MTVQRFEATIAKSGPRTVIRIPFDPNLVWGAKERHHITGTVNEHRVRGPLGSEGSNYFLPLGAAWRRDCGLAVGDHVAVVLAPEGPQPEQLSADIATALAAEPQAKRFFASLASFYRNNYIKWIESAKRPETRTARIAEMMTLLKAGQKQR